MRNLNLKQIIIDQRDLGETDRAGRLVPGLAVYLHRELLLGPDHHPRALRQPPAGRPQARPHLGQSNVSRDCDWDPQTPDEWVGVCFSIQNMFCIILRGDDNHFILTWPI